MSNGEDFQKERLEWSRWKHEILEGYLGAMSGILQRYRTIYYVDGFAGPGQYTEDGAPGSPLLAAQLAEHVDKDPKRRYKLHCINVEKDEGVFPNLEAATAPYSRYVTNHRASFADVLDYILDQISDRPALIFLDPIGIKGLEFKRLYPLLNRGIDNEYVVTELLIRYDVQRALRDTGYADSEWEKAESNLQRLLDVHDAQGMEELEPYLSECDEADGPCRKEAITRAYQDNLRVYFDYVLRIPIRSETDQLKYYLIFATRDLTGVRAMNDVLYKVEGLREEEKSAKRVQSSFWDDESFQLEDTTQDLNDLKDIIQEILLPTHTMERGELRAKVALKDGCFGRFSASHFTAALGGRPRSLKVSKEFRPLEDNYHLVGKPGNDKTKIMRLS